MSLMTLCFCDEEVAVFGVSSFLSFS